MPSSFFYKMFIINYFNFPIVNFPFIYTNIPAALAFMEYIPGHYISHLI